MLRIYISTKRHIISNSTGYWPCKTNNKTIAGAGLLHWHLFLMQCDLCCGQVRIIHSFWESKWWNHGDKCSPVNNHSHSCKNSRCVWYAHTYMELIISSSWLDDDDFGTFELSQEWISLHEATKTWHCLKSRNHNLSPTEPPNITRS